MKIEINIDDRLISRIKTFFSKRKTIAFFTICFVISIVITKAADFSLHVFEPDTVISSADVNENFANLHKQISANTKQIDANTPAGTVIAYAGSTIQEGWLECDGTAVSRTDYSILFAALGTSWGAGDGSTTFNLPDLRGRFLRGVDGLAGNDADKSSRTAVNGGNSGNAVGSYQGDAIRNIRGEAYSLGTSHFQSVSSPGAFQSEATVHGSGWDDNGTNETFYNIFFDASKANGVVVGSDNRPKNAYVYYIIKAN